MRAQFKTAFESLNPASLLRAALALAFLLIAGQTFWTIRVDRAATLDAEHRNGLATVRILAAHAALSFQNGVDRLATIATTVRTMSASEEEIRGIVQAHDLRGNPYIASLQFVNNAGVGWAGSHDRRVEPAAVSMHEHVRFLMAHPDHHGTVVGRPAPATGSVPATVPLARNLFDD